MPKMKTHKGFKKRFRVTRRGKVLHYPAGHRKFRTGKSSKRLRRGRKKKGLIPVFAAQIARRLGRIEG